MISNIMLIHAFDTILYILIERDANISVGIYLWYRTQNHVIYDDDVVVINHIIITQTRTPALSMNTIFTYNKLKAT